jgi:cobalt/nickel transport system permease protein
VFNMGVMTAFVGFGIYWLASVLSGGGRQAVLLGAAGAAWTSVMLAALLTSAQLATSDTSPWSVVLPAMMGVHALIGIGEGLITAGAVAFVLATRPDLIQAPSGRPAAVPALP